jgi:uncharacterized membrane protein YedE/YeeE
MENFTPIPALLGGMLIGLSAVIMLAVLGRIAGISGILGGLLTVDGGDRLWRLLFIAGLVAGAGLYAVLGGDVGAIDINPFKFSDGAQTAVLIAAGLLVGFGTQIGSGCTSGHGVCGLGRFSPRSLTATVVFMGIAGLVVAAVRLGLGG